MQFLTKCWSALLKFLKSPRALLYLLIALGAVALEMKDALLSNSGLSECESHVDDATTMFYQRYATAEFRKPRAHYVRLIVLSDKTIPPDVWANACKKRKYVAEILRRLGTLDPAAIAIDVEYPLGVCKGEFDEASTAALKNAVRDVSETIPVIMGESEKPEGKEDVKLILQPHEEFEGTQLTSGLARLACDTRAVPLFWFVYPDEEAVLNKSSTKPESKAQASIYDCELGNPKQAPTVGNPTPHPEPHWEPTFSYQSARTYDCELQRVLDKFGFKLPNKSESESAFLPKYAFPLVGKFLPKNEFPFISFIPEDNFQHIPPDKLHDTPQVKQESSSTAPLDSRHGPEPRQGKDTITFGAPTPSRELIDIKPQEIKLTDDLREMLRGKIVLIGQTQGDLHNTAIGEVYGYLLQANYIEALLDDRYFGPTNPLLEMLFAVLGILAILVTFEAADEFEAIPPLLRPILGFGLAVIFVAIIFVFCSVWRTYFGRELGFWAPLVPVPFLELIFSWRALARSRPTA